MATDNVSQCLTWSSDYDYDGIARGFCMTKICWPYYNQQFFFSNDYFCLNQLIEHHNQN